MTRFARIARDLCLIGVGALTFIQTPPSVQEGGLNGALGFVWATMIGGGACASLCGLIRHHLAFEVMGCSFVGGGFAVWAFTSVTKPDVTLTSIALALVFLSGTAGQFYRIGMITEGRVNRE